MKLFYYQHEGILNFGDDLNPWLWERLLPGQLDQDESITLVGIGTLLHDQLPQFTRGAKQRWIFSSGVGYFNGPPPSDETYRFYCVRGPLSARALGLPEDRAVADGALLVRRLYERKSDRRYRFAFMPHLDEIAAIGWSRACDELGIHFIDPRWPTERVLDSLSETEILLAEAMHGAIVADALRTPWVPIVTSDRVLRFKWEDWCQSLGLEYSPVRLTAQVNPREKRDILTPVREARYWMLRKTAVNELKKLTQNIRPMLSSDRMMEDRTQQLEERLEELKKDIRAAKRTPYAMVG
jgi:succinoglycan biosynthesis protein ExoV